MIEASLFRYLTDKFWFGEGEGNGCKELFCKKVLCTLKKLQTDKMNKRQKALLKKRLKKNELVHFF